MCGPFGRRAEVESKAGVPLAVIHDFEVIVVSIWEKTPNCGGL